MSLLTDQRHRVHKEGGTHRHEYSRDGRRIGFTYDDFIQQHIQRTIGNMEVSDKAPDGYTHYFAILLKPAEMEKSNPGEIVKATGDSWVDSKGKMRAFIGDVRAENTVDYKLIYLLQISLMMWI